jgi:hypothetical protein
VGGYLKDDVEDGEEYMTEAQAKHINMIKQFTTYHVFRFAKCNKEGDVFIRGKEWGRKDVFYPWEPRENTPLILGYVLSYMLVMLNIITVNDMLFLSHSHVSLLLIMTVYK